MGKLATPDWIREGYDSKEEYEKSKGIKNKKKDTKNPADFGATKSKTKNLVGKEKTFKIRRCPKCKSDDVAVLLTGEEGKGKGEWECKKCGWIGRDVKEDEVSEDDFMKYLDEKGEEVM